jgi:perosamine synthetase
MDELSCAMGLEQLKKVEFILNKRRELADKYGEVLKQIDEIVTPYVDPRADISWWVYYLQAREGLDRDKVLRYLNENGVSSRSYFYPPIHLQPVYKKLFGYVGGELPVTERVSARGFIIPFFIDMTDEQIDRVCTVITEAVRKHKR